MGLGVFMLSPQRSGRLEQNTDGGSGPTVVILVGCVGARGRTLQSQYWRGLPVPPTIWWLFPRLFGGGGGGDIGNPVGLPKANIHAGMALVSPRFQCPP